MVYEYKITVDGAGYSVKCPYCTALLRIHQDIYQPKPDDLISCYFHGAIRPRWAVFRATKTGDLQMTRAIPIEVSTPVKNSMPLVNNDTSDARQRLIDAQKQAINYQKFQPRYENRPHCNQATVSIARATGAPLGPLVGADGAPLLANQIAQNLSNPKNGYHTVSEQQAQEIANHGGFVIATGPGLAHVETVSPDTGQNLTGSGPVIGMVGYRNGFMRLSQTFKPAVLPNVKFYTPN